MAREVFDRLRPRLVRDPEVLVAAPVEHERALGVGGPREVGGEARFADPGLTRDDDDLTPLVGFRRGQGAVEHGPLTPAADERDARFEPDRQRYVHAGRPGPSLAAGAVVRLSSGASAGTTGGGSHRTSWATTGAGSPFSSSVPTGSKVCPPRLPTRERTLSLTRIWPGWAAASSRAASTTGVPWQSCAMKCTSPALSPTRSTICWDGWTLRL